MAVYVMGDIHGEYEMFQEVLDQLSLKETDTLYVLGDIIDRGPHSFKVLMKLMEMKNVIPLLGNHEWMALEWLKCLSGDNAQTAIMEMPEEKREELLNWQKNGGRAATDEFHRLSQEQKRAAIQYMEQFLLYKMLTVGEKTYLLVHAGLGNYHPDKAVEEYTPEELLWEAADYEREYFPDICVVTGHTPTWFIESNPAKGRIYRKHNHIAMDCGAGFEGGRLAAICLDTGEEFYSRQCV